MAAPRETHVARVTKNQDPLFRGRLKVSCASLMGDGKTELPGWIEPSFDWGVFVVPDIGEYIEIECTGRGEHVDDSHYQEFLMNPNIRWTGRRLEAPKSDTPRPPDPIFTKEAPYAKRRGFCTPSGHFLMFDDTPGKEQVTLALKDPTKSNSFASLNMDLTGGISISSDNGTLINLHGGDPATGGAMILDNHANLIFTSEKGVFLVDRFSNMLKLEDSGAGPTVTLLSQGDLVVNSTGITQVIAPKVEIKSGDVLVGDGADSPFVRHTEWVAWAENHIHPTAFGPSGFPVLPPPLAIASTTASVKCSIWAILGTLLMMFWFLR